MSIFSLADFNGVGPPVGSVLVRTDIVTDRGPLRVDQVKEVGRFSGHTRGHCMAMDSGPVDCLRGPRPLPGHYRPSRLETAEGAIVR